MYFVMVLYEVTAHAPKVCTVFLLILPRRAFRSVGLRNIEEFQRSVYTSKQQFSFICDFFVLEPFEVNICGWQGLEIYICDEKIA